MADQVIAPIIPNLGAQSEAISGSQGAIFTATDRQVIKERSGEVDPAKTFKELFLKRDLTPKVENEQSTVNPEMDLEAMESRQRAHRRMLKYSAITAPHEHVELSGQVQEEAVAMTPPEVTIGASNRSPGISNQPPITNDKAHVDKREIKVPREAEDYDRIAAEQKQLNNIMSRIQELNFKRVLCDNEAEFEKLSEEIKQSTLAASQPEARSYLEAKVDAITKTTAEYKLKVLQSLESINYDEHDKNVKWLNKMTAKYSEKG
jgi:hypothetical protein